LSTYWESDKNKIIPAAISQLPRHQCTFGLSSFSQQHHWVLSENEQVYLTIHIWRVTHVRQA
jgi:hypothetical protein